jgi:hypothetical protein
MAKFNVVFKHDDNVPVCTLKVEKESVCNGMYKEACNELFAKTIACTVKIGYVRMYVGAKLIKEFHCEQSISNSAAVTTEVASGLTQAEIEAGVLNSMLTSDKEDCV